MKLSGRTPIVVLTGAGVSAESGIKTFRAADGLWENHRIEDVASPGGFERNPELVQRFYNMRRQHLLSASIQANAAHRALGVLSRALGDQCLLVTQNVDDLHERCETQHLVSMHGKLLEAFCDYCGHHQRQLEDLCVDSICPSCGVSGRLRPDIVWFGEMPKYMERIYSALAACKLFIAIGTSGNVYPAAGFVQAAKSVGAVTLAMNVDAAANNADFDEHIYGPATQTVPELVQQLINDGL